MSATSRTLWLSAFLALSGLTAAPGCLIVADDDSTLTIENDSDFFLDDIRIRDVGTSDWGPNLAPLDGLAPGDALVLEEIECDFYDLSVIDEDGEGCDFFDIDLCLNDALFIYRNNSCDILERAVKDQSRAAVKKAEAEKAKQAEPAEKAQ